MRKKRRKPRSNVPTSNTIAFRADRALLRAIDRAARKLRMSRGEFVRLAVIEYFAVKPRDVVENLDEQSAALRLIRRNQARMLVALLIEGSKLPVEQAKEIARTSLLS